MARSSRPNAQLRYPKSRILHSKFIRCLVWIPKCSYYMIKKLASFLCTLLLSLIPPQIKGGPKSKFSKRRRLTWLPYLCNLCAKFIHWLLCFTLFRYLLKRITRSKTLTSTQYFLNWLLSMSSIMPESIKKGGIGHEFKFPNCVYCVVRKCMSWILSVGPIPRHIAFIMDGNRRFANKRGIKTGSAYHAGFLSLMTVVDVCYELGVKYVTIYAFSIDNFRRKSDEVGFLMGLLGNYLGSLSFEKNMIDKFGIRINFMGNLSLLPESIRLEIDQVMASTKKNNDLVLSICVAYTSTDEIVHAIQESCTEKLAKVEGEIHGGEGVVTVSDLDRHMYMSGLPDPDLLVRSSGRSRLSNFLLWQTTHTCLEAPDELWPDMSAQTMFWVILKYQRVQSYLKLRKL